MATPRRDLIVPSDIVAIARGTEQVFEHKRSSLVLGLTGRTGSGCSTVADEVLTKLSFRDLRWPAGNVPPADHEDRKDRIVELWLTNHWAAFRKIQVSQIILSFALEEEPDGFTALGQRLGQRDELESFRGMVVATNVDAHENRQILESLPKQSSQNVERAVQYYFSRVPELAKELRDVAYFGKRGPHTTLFQELRNGPWSRHKHREPLRSSQAALPLNRARQGIQQTARNTPGLFCNRRDSPPF